ncbi:MAG: hypothetical protein ACYC5Y_05240 [Symbiobacteriia bacterium]
MSSLSVDRRIEGRLLGRPHLLPVWGGVFHIPQRVRAYDPNLYVTLDVVRLLQKARGEKPQPPPAGVIPLWGAWYEIRSLVLPAENDLVMSVRYGGLDARILADLWRGDLRQRGAQVFSEISEHNERLEREKQRQAENDLGAIARDIRRPFADALGGSHTLFGYR